MQGNQKSTNHFRGPSFQHRTVIEVVPGAACRPEVVTCANPLWHRTLLLERRSEYFLFGKLNHITLQAEHSRTCARLRVVGVSGPNAAGRPRAGRSDSGPWQKNGQPSLRELGALSSELSAEARYLFGGSKDWTDNLTNQNQGPGPILVQACYLHTLNSCLPANGLD